LGGKASNICISFRAVISRGPFFRFVLHIAAGSAGLAVAARFVDPDAQGESVSSQHIHVFTSYDVGQMEPKGSEMREDHAADDNEHGGCRE
jgi:hypothetical protein